jgi:hypothetical protein
VALATANIGGASAVGYSVVSGQSATGAAAPTLPHTVGQLTYIMDDSSPAWQTYPNLLPSSPKSTYTVVTGTYANISPSIPGVIVDIVVATQKSTDGDHRGVFSLSPQALVGFAANTMNTDSFRDFPARETNAVLECGDYGDAPLCVWADSSTLIFLQYLGTPGTVADLAEMTPSYKQAIAGD